MSANKVLQSSHLQSIKKKCIGFSEPSKTNVYWFHNHAPTLFTVRLVSRAVILRAKQLQGSCSRSAEAFYAIQAKVLCWFTADCIFRRIMYRSRCSKRRKSHEPQTVLVFGRQSGEFNRSYNFWERRKHFVQGTHNKHGYTEREVEDAALFFVPFYFLEALSYVSPQRKFWAGCFPRRLS